MAYRGASLLTSAMISAFTASGSVGQAAEISVNSGGDDAGSGAAAGAADAAGG